MRLVFALAIVAALTPAVWPAAPQQQDRIDHALELVRQQKFEQALEEFRAIVEAERGNRRAAALLAGVELQTGHIQECLDRARKLLEDDPRNPELHELIGQACMARRDWESAEKEWRAVLEERPVSEQAHIQLAAVLLQRNQFETALAEVTRALEINPRRSDARSLRGNILASLGRMDAAAKEWTTALAADPNDSVALSGLAVYLRERDPDRALAYAARAVEITGGKALGPVRVLALVHRARGEPEQALQVLERAVLTFPDSELLQAELRALRGMSSGTSPSSSTPSTAPASDVWEPPAQVAGLTLGASAVDLEPLVKLPAPPAPSRRDLAAGVVARSSAPRVPQTLEPPLVRVAGLTLGASAVDLQPLLELPAPPAPSRRERAFPALAPPVYDPGVTLGASVGDLWPLLREPRLTPVAGSGSASATRSAAGQIRDSTDLSPPVIEPLPLSFIVPAFVYADVVSPPLRSGVEPAAAPARLKRSRESGSRWMASPADGPPLNR